VWIAAGVLVVVGAPIAWYLGSPLFITRAVDEPFPVATGTPASATAPADATGARVVARGTFAGSDGVHKGTGTATIYRAGGALILRFDAFTVTNGPDLHVILVKHPSPKTARDVDGYLEVGKLKGNTGSQNYALPAGIDLAGYRTVVIYCRPFHVVFATAPLSASN
jgi:hypothetical protein